MQIDEQPLFLLAMLNVAVDIAQNNETDF